MKSIVKLKSSKLKNISFLIFTAALVFLAFEQLEKAPLSAYIGIILFTLCALVFLIKLLPNASYLELKSDGFEFKSLYRGYFVPWTDVNHFVVIKLSGLKMVSWYYLKNKNTNTKKNSKFVSGAQAMLPETYGLKAKDLAKLMNEYKNYYS